ncbi:hypothetical protein D3C81_1660820 [compost metagenome]
MLYARFVLHLTRCKPIVDYIGDRKTQLPPALIVYPALNGRAACLQRFRGKEIYIGTLCMTGIGKFTAEHRDLSEHSVRLVWMIPAYQHSNQRAETQGAAAGTVGSIQHGPPSPAELPG